MCIYVCTYIFICIKNICIYIGVIPILCLLCISMYSGQLDSIFTMHIYLGLTATIRKTTAGNVGARGGRVNPKPVQNKITRFCSYYASIHLVSAER